MRNLKIHPKFKEKFKIKKGLRKMAKLNRMNTRFQRGAVEIALDLFKGLSQYLISGIPSYSNFVVEIALDLFKGLSLSTLQYLL